jgi:glutamyl endopeptidase
MSTTAHSSKVPVKRNDRVGMPFPPDSRVRVTQTTQAPWSGTGLVSATFPLTIGEATGFAIGDRYVVTAAHAVYDDDLGGMATKVSFQPGRNADSPPVFKTFNATAWHIPDDYPIKDLAQDDYCLLVLDAPMPTEVVRYQLTAADDATLGKTEYQIAGYPDDKPPDNSLWYDAGRLTSVDRLLLEYRISTAHGESGAAVASYLDTSSTKAVGIHCRVNKGKTANVAVRVTNSVIAHIDAWKRE